jgi:hypothetical protein
VPQAPSADVIKNLAEGGSRRYADLDEPILRRGGCMIRADEAGVTLFDLRLARDGETYAYSVNRTVSDLFLLEGYVAP